MKDLNEYINENLETINEVSMNPKKAEQCIKNSYEEDGDAVSIGSCWQWLDGIDWKKAMKMDDKKLINTIMNINDDIDSDMALDRYIPVMRSLLFLGRDAAYEYLKSFIDDEELEDYGIND